MVAQLTAEEVRSERGRAGVERWHPLVRAGFRFGFVFLGVGMAGVWVGTALLRSFGVPQGVINQVGKWGALHPVTDWVGVHIFDTTVDYAPTSSSDTATHWISIFVLLMVAVATTVVWSALDRGRPNYARLNEWFQLLLRAALVSALLLYGMIKVLPTQMSFNLERLVEPFGDMSPMAVLWAQTSASEPYEIALGTAELAAALLLVWSATARMGAVLAFVVTLQVALLNLTFDVPVKIFSLQLLAYSTVLAAPEIVRMVEALIDRAVPVRRNRILLAAQLVFGGWLLFTAITEGYDGWQSYGSARPQSPLYGIWDVTDYTAAGQQLPPLVDFNESPESQIPSATERFRRIIFDIPDAVTAQRMNDSLLSFPAEIDTERHTIALSRDLAHQWRITTLNYEQPQPDRLILIGQLGGRPVRLQLDRVDLNRYPVVSRGFHWVQPAPYIR